MSDKNVDESAVYISKLKLCGNLSGIAIFLLALIFLSPLMYILIFLFQMLVFWFAIALLGIFLATPIFAVYLLHYKLVNFWRDANVAFIPFKGFFVGFSVGNITGAAIYWLFAFWVNEFPIYTLLFHTVSACIMVLVFYFLFRFTKNLSKNSRYRRFVVDDLQKVENIVLSSFGTHSLKYDVGTWSQAPGYKIEGTSIYLFFNKIQKGVVGVGLKFNLEDVQKEREIEKSIDLLLSTSRQ